MKSANHSLVTQFLMLTAVAIVSQIAVQKINRAIQAQQGQA